jgi:hypothetical protein
VLPTFQTPIHYSWQGLFNQKGRQTFLAGYMNKLVQNERCLALLLNDVTFCAFLGLTNDICKKLERAILKNQLLSGQMLQHA